MSDADDVEQRLRIEQMTLTIDKMHADLRWETRTFVVSAIVATAAALGAGAAPGSYFTRPPGLQTIIIQQQPYTPPAP